MNYFKIPPGFDPGKYKIDDTLLNSNKTLYTFSDDQNSNVLEIDIEKEFNDFQYINFCNEIHKKVLLEMYSEFLLDTANDIDKELFVAMSRFDTKNMTFVTGCFTHNFTLISYKRRKVQWMLSKKWITRKGTSPNSTLFHRIYTDYAPIYFIEGHKDALTAVLLGLDFVMIPYAGYRYRGDTHSYILKEIEGRNLVFIVEDESAYKCMIKFAELLKKSAESIELKQFSKDQKMDLSDFTQKFKTIKETLYELCN